MLVQEDTVWGLLPGPCWEPQLAEACPGHLAAAYPETALNGATLLTGVGRAHGLKPGGVKRSDRLCEAARRTQPLVPLISQT